MPVFKALIRPFKEKDLPGPWHARASECSPFTVQLYCSLFQRALHCCGGRICSLVNIYSRLLNSSCYCSYSDHIFSHFHITMFQLSPLFSFFVTTSTFYICALKLSLGLAVLFLFCMFQTHITINPALRLACLTVLHMS